MQGALELSGIWLIRNTEGQFIADNTGTSGRDLYIDCLPVTFEWELGDEAEPVIEAVYSPDGCPIEVMEPVRDWMAKKMRDAARSKLDERHRESLAKARTNSGRDWAVGLARNINGIRQELGLPPLTA